MEILIAILAILFAVIGILGSVVPALPGPPIAWVGVLMMYLWGGTNADGEPMSLSLMLILLALTVVVLVIDYIVPAWFTKVTGGSKYASRGAMIGLFAGMIIPLPIGMIMCSLIGAFIGEYCYAKKDTGSSIKSSLGAFLGFLLGSGIKIISCGVMLYYIIVYI